MGAGIVAADRLCWKPRRMTSDRTRWHQITAPTGTFTRPADTKLLRFGPVGQTAWKSYYRLAIMDLGVRSDYAGSEQMLSP